MSGNQEIDRLFRDCSEIDKFLSRKEPSLKVDFDSISTKYVVICVASQLETDTKNFLAKIFAKLSNPNTSNLVSSFLKSAVLARGFHTLFNWPDNKNRASSMGAFYAKFGNGAKEFFLGREKNDGEFEQSARAFLRIGHWRNELVHNNLAAFNLSGNCHESMHQLSVKEVQNKYEEAAKFLPKFAEHLRDYIELGNAR